MQPCGFLSPRRLPCLHNSVVDDLLAVHLAGHASSERARAAVGVAGAQVGVAVREIRARAVADDVEALKGFPAGVYGAAVGVDAVESANEVLRMA